MCMSMKKFLVENTLFVHVNANDTMTSHCVSPSIICLKLGSNDNFVHSVVVNVVCHKSTKDIQCHL